MDMHDYNMVSDELLELLIARVSRNCCFVFLCNNVVLRETTQGYNPHDGINGYFDGSKKRLILKRQMRKPSMLHHPTLYQV